MPVDILADRPINPDEGIPKPQIDVTAQPVDTYVKPVSASASALGQLAGSLKSLNPALGQIEEKFKQQAVEQGQTAGAEAFAQTKGDYATAVKQGLLPTVFNPFARMSARETFGHLAAEKSRSDMWSDKDFLTAMNGATTMQQFDSAVSTYQNKWEGQNLGHDSHSDPLFQHAFQELRSGRLADDRQKFTEKVNENFVGTTMATNVANAAATINGSIEDGEFSTDPSLLSKTLDNMGQSLRQQGFSDKFVSNVMTEALKQVAQDAARGVVGDGSLGADDIMKLAHHIKGYGGNTLWDSMGDTRTAVLDSALRQEIQQSRENKYEDTVQRTTTIHAVHAELQADFASGQIKPMDYYRNKLDPVDTREAQRFPALYADLTGGNWADNKQAYARLATGIKDPSAIHFTTTKDALADALHAHDITPQTYLSLSKQLDAHNNPKGRQKTAFGDPVYHLWHETSKAGVMMGDPTYGQNRVIGGDIVDEVGHEFLNWYDGHPEATWDEKHAFLQQAEHAASVRFGGQAYRDYQTDNPGAGHHGQIKPEEWAHQRILDPLIMRGIVREFHDGKISPETWDYLGRWGVTDPKQAATIVAEQAATLGVKYTPASKSEMAP